MANMDISEHRKPQDGKIDFSRFGGPPVELRVVTVPTSRGLEDVVLRLLAGAKPLPLDAIGLTPTNLKAMRDMVRKPYGLVLVVGPTGCGKDHHAALGHQRHQHRRPQNLDGRGPDRNHPEWSAPGAGQPASAGPLRPRCARFYARTPDVIMIGEMRDEETSRIAIEASLTGHLVLSTLHTNSAPESIARLLEIGLDRSTSRIRCSPSLRSAWCGACARLAANPWWQTTKRCWTWHRSTCPAARATARRPCGAGSALAQELRCGFWRIAALAPRGLPGVRGPRLPRAHGHP